MTQRDDMKKAWVVIVSNAAATVWDSDSNDVEGAHAYQDIIIGVSDTRENARALAVRAFPDHVIKWCDISTYDPDSDESQNVDLPYNGADSQIFIRGYALNEVWDHAASKARFHDWWNEEVRAMDAQRSVEP